MRNNTWEYNYNLAKVYYEHHGNLEIPKSFKTTNGYEYDENGLFLGKWISNQRNTYYMMTDEKIKLLEEIGMIWNQQDNQWTKNYNLAKAYYEHHGNLEIPQGFKTKNGYEYDKEGIALGTWIVRQRRAYYDTGTCKITDEKIKQLEEIGMIWSQQDNKWTKNYNLAKAYYEHHGNLKVPVNFKTKNGYEYDKEGIALGNWIQNQRQAYYGKGHAKITEKRIKLLEEIGMIWGNQNNKWTKNYNLAKAYYEHYGDLEIPRGFKTKNGYEYDKEGIALENWIRTQRSAYYGKGHAKITEKRIKLLEEIGMVWDQQNNKWIKNYNLAKAYYEHHGNLEVPVSFRTKNGYEYDEEGIALGNWIFDQRRAYHGIGTCKITDERVKQLEEIGMIWNPLNDQWTKNYNLAKAYYEHHGNLEIPQSFRTKNGYEYDKEGIALGIWIFNQRSAYCGIGTYIITDEKIKQLEKIGMKWYIKEQTKIKHQNEEISDLNKIRKQKEILNIIKSYLNTYNDNQIPTKQEINEGMIKFLGLKKNE